MPSTRRSTVLGKRGHQDPAPSPAPSEKVDQLLTPDGTPHPKRPRTSTSLEGDDSNKENIPPLKDNVLNTPVSPRAARALRRTATEAAITPRRSRPGIRRSASSASVQPETPTTEAVDLKVNTPPPSPPTILQPVHVQVRALLRNACNGSSGLVAGREVERVAITEFLASLDNADTMEQDDIPTALFISGSPGTGKTALVHDVIRGIETTAKVISINCMALKTVDALWDRMVEELGDLPKKKGSAKKVKGRDAVVAALNTLRVKCILVLDELDHITPNAASLATIFSLSEKHASILRLVGIANTHTLTSNNLVASAAVKTVHFAPYTPAQLQAILQSRLGAISNDAEMAPRLKKLLPPATLMLLTKKISSLTGDVRSLFEVLRGAINIAASATTADTENPLDTPAPTVTPQHILTALKAYSPAAPRPSAPSATTATTTSNSETVTKVRNLGLQSRVALLTILLASNRIEAGLPLSSTPVNASPKKSSISPIKRSHSLPTSPTTAVGIETSALYSYYTGALSRTERGLFDAVSKSEFGDVLGMLEGVGLVSLSSSVSGAASVQSSPSKGRRAFSRTASFGPGLKGASAAGAVGEVRLVEGIWADEVLRGLGVSEGEVPSDPREEEVRGIWEREKARLKRDVKAAAAAATTPVDVFSGAFEDD